MIEEKATTSSYLQVDSIPPLPLFALFAADNDQLNGVSTDTDNGFKTENDAKAKKSTSSFDIMAERKQDELDDDFKFNLNEDDDNFDLDGLDREKHNVILLGNILTTVYLIELDAKSLF